MLITVLDVETTGLSRQLDEILELGYIRFDNESLQIHSYGELFFYQEEYPVEKYPACDLHGLKRDFLKRYEKNYEENIAALFALTHRGIILGKNSNGFDIPMIQAYLSRHTGWMLTPTPFAVLDMQEYYTPIFRNYYLETHGETTKKKGSLTELMDMLGYTQDELRTEYSKIFTESVRNGAHSALFDAYEAFLLVRHGVENNGMSLKMYGR